MRRVPTLTEVRRELHSQANPDDAAILQRFFRTGPGQYGEGDRFLGIRVPPIRQMVRCHRTLPLKSIESLLQSPWHEERLLALLLLAERYRRGNPVEREKIHRTYLAHTRQINNWDLVDLSAEHLVGAHISPDDDTLLKRLARSSSLWERRIAMLATFHWIKHRDFRLALRVARILLHDEHDLIHKAVGWMLREVGKRDQPSEERFLRLHYRTMPRTMLRYAIERFPETQRQRYMKGRI